MLVEYLCFVRVLRYLIVIEAFLIQHSFIVFRQSWLLVLLILLNELNQLLTLRAQALYLIHFDISHVDIQTTPALTGSSISIVIILGRAGRICIINFTLDIDVQILNIARKT